MLTGIIYRITLQGLCNVTPVLHLCSSGDAIYVQAGWLGLSPGLATLKRHLEEPELVLS